MAKRVVKRVAVEDGALAAREPDLDLRPVLRRAPRVTGQQHVGAQPVELDGDDLAQARGAVTLQHDVTADRQLQAVPTGSYRRYSEAWKENRRPSTEVASGRTDASRFRRASRKLST